MSVRLMPAVVPVSGGAAECQSSEGCYGSSRFVDYPLCIQDGHLDSGQYGSPPHYVSLETCESRNRLVQCTLAVAGPFLNCQLSRWIDIDYRSLQTPKAFNQFKSQ